MRKPELMLLVFFAIVNLSALAQNQNSKFKLLGQDKRNIQIDETFVDSKEIRPFEDRINKIYGLAVDANIEFAHDKSQVRFVLIDENFDEHLIYEAYPLLSGSNKMTVEESCEETALLDGIKPYALQVEVIDAEVNLHQLTYAGRSNVTNIKKVQKETRENQNADKVARLNQHIKAIGQKWVAGATSVSEMSYAERKKLYGQSTFPAGFEFYCGGVISAGDETSTSTNLKSATTASPYVDDWDWRNRHGKNWISPITNQGSCGSCWAFASTGAVEAITNVFFNQLINPDLSEQDVLSCSGAGSCDGGYPAYALDYAINTGLVDENTFPYQALDLDCTDKGTNPSEKIKISGRIDFGYDDYLKTEDNLKKMLIQFGPLSGGVITWSHAMVLVGYKIVDEGDYFYYRNLDGMRYWKTVQPDDALIGKVVWIFKNSWGDYFGDQGYVYVETPITNMGWTHALQTPVTSVVNDYEVICTDADGDGYYWWGLGPKPANCPECPDLADGDDSDPTKGPLDEYGYCMPLNTTGAPAVNFTASSTTVSTGESVSFTDGSTNNPTSWSWTFEGGTPATSTAQNPTVTYSTAGEYSVTLSVSNSSGSNTITKSNLIEVTNPVIAPEADFTADASEIYEGDQISFSDATTNNPTSWEWTFAGGNPETSTAQNPTVTYNTPGTYSVTLSATNSGGSDTKTVSGYITVNRIPTPPSANFMADVTNLKEEGTVSFTDLSTNTPSSWNWTFEGGTPDNSSEQNPSITYHSPGTYSVTLTATNNDGDGTKTATGYISVIAKTPPVSNFTANLTTIEEGSSVQFTDLSTNSPDEWQWEFQGGESNDPNIPNPSVTYNTAGTYDVTLTTTNADGTDQLTKTGFITVTQQQAVVLYPPVANFSYSSNSIETGQTVTFTDQSSNSPNTWKWTFAGNEVYTSTAQNPVITFNSADSYDVTLIASNDDGSDTTLVESCITVTNPPAPEADFSADNTQITEGEQISFTDKSTNTPETWYWEFEGGTPATSTARNPKVTYQNPNSYKVSLTVTNKGGNDKKTVENYVKVEKAQPAYCIPSPLASEEWISKVSIGDNVKTSESNGGYADFTSTTFDFENGNSYTLELVPGFSSRSKFEYWAIWIDFNGDMEFADSEKVFTSSKSKSAVSGSLSFADGLELTTRMRVAMGKSEPTACGFSDMGEVEDYTINVHSPQPEPPVADFAANVYTIYEGESIQFSDLSANEPESYSWSFPGAEKTSSTLQNPTVTYLTAGVYDVSLTVGKDGFDPSTKSKSKIITVKEMGTVSYCTPSNINSADNYITKVEVGSFSRTSAKEAYSNYTTETIGLIPGSSYNVNLAPSLSGSRNFWRIWIDFNNDGDFDDSDETVLAENNNKGNVASTISIPVYATGDVRMRITMKTGKAPAACDDGFEGEVEDYTISFGGASASSSEKMSASASPFVNDTDEFLTVYPNPTTDNVHLRISVMGDNDSYAVYNSVGVKIMENTISAPLSIIDLSEQPAGMFIVVINSQSNSFIRKIIKK